MWDILDDLGTVHVWNLAIANANFTSKAEAGVGAARRCDFPDGGYVKERAIKWNPGEASTMYVHEDSVPFDNFYGTYTTKDDGQGTTVSFTLEYELKPDAPVDPQEVERQNREELIPMVLASLKYHAETGEPVPIPAPAGTAAAN